MDDMLPKYPVRNIISSMVGTTMQKLLLLMLMYYNTYVRIKDLYYKF